MPENFDSEQVLKEILEVLRKHSIPVQTVALEFSMLNSDYDDIFPEFKEWKQGIFHRWTRLNDVPMVLSIKRRLPFAEVIPLWEQRVVEPARKEVELLQGVFPQVRITHNSRVWQHEPSTRADKLYRNYAIVQTKCFFTEDLHADYHALELAFQLRQDIETDYPSVRATMGWLADEEGEGDWGLDNVVEFVRQFDNEVLFPEAGVLEQLFIPGIYEEFRMEIEKRLSGGIDAITHSSP